jgi:hypothetical protein
MLWKASPGGTTFGNVRVVPRCQGHNEVPLRIPPPLTEQFLRRRRGRQQSCVVIPRRAKNQAYFAWDLPRYRPAPLPALVSNSLRLRRGQNDVNIQNPQLSSQPPCPHCPKPGGILRARLGDWNGQMGLIERRFQAKAPRCNIEIALLAAGKQRLQILI